MKNQNWHISSNYWTFWGVTFKESHIRCHIYSTKAIGRSLVTEANWRLLHRVCPTDNFLSPMLLLYPCKVSGMLHHGSVGPAHSKECYYNLSLHILPWHFVVVFHQKNVFLSFHFFFWWSIKFLQQNINQSETGTCYKKLSVELYA